MVSINLSDDLANSSQPEPSLLEDVFVFPLSFSQQRLWLLDQIEGENAAYNIPMAMLLTGMLNIPALEQAFGEIVARHESLRTNFQVVDDVPMQLIAEGIDFQMEMVDMPVTTGLPALPVHVEQFIIEETQRPFNLIQDALFRVKLVRLDTEYHVLIVTMHHIIADGWSLGVLSQELTELYNAFKVGKPSPLAPLPIQYADFAHWQQDFLAGDQLNAHLNYWQQKLAGIPPLLELPTDRLRPSVQTLKGDTVEFQLSPELSKDLKQLAQRSQSTLFMTLMAAFSVLLHRYSGFDDIVVGSPIANRQRPELEPLIGCFINTLVFRTQLTNNPTFNEVLAQVRQTALEAYAHQDLPFEKLVEELKPERSLSHSPLFQVMFILHNTPGRHRELDGLSLSPIKRETSVAKFDWNLSMAEVEDASSPYLVGRWEYNRDLFDAATVKRAVGHFKTLLQAVVANPDAQVTALPLLTAGEQQQLLVDWNDTETAYPQDKCLHQLIEAQAARTPDAVAVGFNEHRLTYADLNERANQLAAYLRSCGVGPEVLVGLYVERSLDMVVALLGILKAGGAYVPLDPSYPCDRISYILANSQAKLVITQQTLLPSLPAQSDTQSDIQLVCLDTDWPTIAQAKPSSSVNVGPDNLAYVIYTSGSTGKPKGVEICHRSLINFLTSMQESPGVTSADIMLAVTTICFDIAALELYLPLMVGAQIVLAPRDVAADGQRLMALMTQSGTTVMQATPATWRMLLGAGWQGSSQLKILCGGEALPHTLATDLCSRGAALWNLYGPTETTIWSTRVCLNAAYTSNNDKAESSVAIGRPIANTQLYVLDQSLQPVPIGIPGELHIGGTGVARGYLNRSDLTAARFITHPFSDDPEARLYKTGDLVRYLSDGTLEFLGRIDHQVKIRGFRVELGEIEAALVQHPQIREAVAITRPDESGSQQLIAYLIAHGDHSSTHDSTANTLRPFLKELLPEYMVPAVFVWLERFPLTPNGKIDRKALPTPDPSQRSLGNEFVAPGTFTEKQLAHIWAKLLNLEQVGIHDNFFELGGHSLLATQVVSRIRTKFSVEIPLRLLFESPTITELATQIDQQEANVSQAAIPSITRDRPLPLSFAQQRLWFLDQLEGGSATYNMHNVCRLEGQLNIHALEQALTEIIRRHEILRTQFHTLNGDPIQIITSPKAVKLAIVNLQAGSEEDQLTEVHQLINAAINTPFNLERDDLIRAQLFRLTPESYVLLVTMHHIVADGWSMGLFNQELFTLYQDFSQGNPSSLPGLTIQYADFAHWQRQYLQGAVLERQLSYWKQQLAGAPALLKLPTDKPRPPVQTFQGSRLGFQLDAELSQQLEVLAQQSGTTLFITLLAAFAVLLHRCSHSDDIVIGSPIANRNRREIETLIGTFANTLLLRANLAGNPNFSELLQRLRQVALDAYTHQDLPFEKLIEELQPERNLSYNPLFQVMFALETVTAAPSVLPGLALKSIDHERTTAKFDLSLSMVKTEQGLSGVWIYNTDLFRAETIQTMIAQFQALLEDVVQSPDKAVTLLSTVSLAEQRQASMTRTLQSRIANLSPAKRALLEQKLQQEQGMAQSPSTIGPRPQDQPAVLSSSQQNLWLLDQLTPGNPTHNRPSNLWFTGILDVDALKRSLNEIIRRHEILRTCFVKSPEGQPTQIVASRFSLKLTQLDLTAFPPTEQESKLRQLAIDEAQFSFDLAQLPLVRASLVKLATEEHILLLTLHHTIFDGWSMGLLRNELAVLYNAFANRQPSPLQDLPLQYADFAFWQQQQLQSGKLSSQLAYWRKQLEGNLPVLELPTDRPRAAVQGSQGATHTLMLPQLLKEQLDALCQRTGTTLFMVLLAGFKTLLYRYTHAEDMIVGTLNAGRNSVETEGLIGLLVNTLVLRTSPEGNQSFADFLQQVRQVALMADVHQDMPLSTLIRAIQPERDLSHSTLFQVMFQFRNLPTRVAQMQGLSIKDYQVDTGTTILDLYLEISERSDGLTCAFKYNADLFEASTIQRMGMHFQTLLQGIVTDCTQPLAQLPLLPLAEQQQLLVEWSRSPMDVDGSGAQPGVIQALFEAQVAKTPEAVAIAFANQQLTYRDLNERANQLAHYLQAQGVQPDTLVGVCVERSLDMIVALLGVLKAGGAYVPIDPNYPSERVAFMVSDAQISLLLTQAQWLNSLPESTPQTVCLDQDWTEIATHSHQNPVSPVASDNLAYVIYTSGSTGTPKGVMVQHDSLVNFTQAAVGEYGVTANDRILQFASISFDAAAEEIYPCLSTGGTLVLRTQDMLSSAEEFWQTCQDWQLTVLDLPTAYWQQLTHALATASLPKTLRLVIIGGERVSPAAVRTWQSCVGDYPQLINTYGPTESTVVATALPVTTAIHSEMGIGRAIANIQTYVLDQYLQPVPIGIPGELHIGGVGVARGYLNRPDLTAARFISNPFSDDDAARLYKTGDLVRYLPDGNLEFLGRIDHQVKIRGFRVELGEIEVALVQHPQVRAAVVITRPDQSGSQQLIAYLINHGEQSTVDTPTANDLRSLLKEQLPEYMIPAMFVWLEQLPLTPNGKIDRKALPAPDPSQRALENKFVAPNTETEKQLAQIWADLLNLEQVGVHDSFFELGGHSLLATQMVSRIRTIFSVELPLRTLFELSTIAELADCIEAIQEINQGQRQNSSNWGENTTEEREEIEF